MKVNVLIINTKLSEGGAAKIALTIHKYISKCEEVHSVYAYGRGEVLRNSSYFKFTNKFEIYLSGIITRLTGIQGKGAYLSTKKISKFIRYNKINLVHIHNIHGYYINLSIIEEIKKMDIPIIWTLHDGWALTGRCAFLGECHKWKNGCGNCKDLSAYPKSHIDTTKLMWNFKRAILKNLNNRCVLVTPSIWLYEIMAKSNINKKISIIPNGIDVDKFKPYNRLIIREKLEISNDKNVVLFASADLRDIKKGARYFFEAINLIDVTDLLVLIVGKKYGCQLKLNHKIIELGYIHDENKLAQIYSASDIFCVTSLEENFPTTVLESMACETPVIAFKTGGIPEQILPDCGLIVEKKDVKDLSNKIQYLLSNKEITKKMGKNARKKVLEKYTIKKMCSNYLNLYKNILNVEE